MLETTEQEKISDRSQVDTCEGHLLRGVELDRVDCEEDNRDEIRTGHKPASSGVKPDSFSLIILVLLLLQEQDASVNFMLAVQLNKTIATV